MTQLSYYIGLILAWLTIMTGSLGTAIIVFSLLLKTALLPLSISSQKQMDKMRKLQPHLTLLKTKHKGDAKGFQQAQADLMKEQQVNPVGGCIPQLVQFGVLIMLYQFFNTVFRTGVINGQTFNMEYLWFNLGQPDPTYILPILAGVLQFVLSLMMMGLTPAPAVVEPVSKKKAKKNALAVTPKKPEAQDTMSDFSASMQKQMVFVLPVMTTFSFILLKLPSGLALYWVVTSIYSIVQQYYISGPGALSDYWQKAQTFVSSKTK